MDKLDERDPFVQLIFRSIIMTVVLFFTAGVALEFSAPALQRPLVVPIGAAAFCGTLSFLVEAAQKRYGFAILGFGAAIVLFPGMAWALLHLLHVPLQTNAAAFIALIPQGLMAPKFFFLVRRRFHQKPVSPSTAE